MLEESSGKIRIIEEEIERSDLLLRKEEKDGVIPKVVEKALIVGHALEHGQFSK